MDAILKKGTIKGADDSVFNCRYIVAFMQLSAIIEMNMIKIATSISLVAMVNNTAISSHDVLKNNTISCPSNYSEEMDHAIPKNEGEFNWSPSIQGYILGFLYLGSVATLIPGGILAETYGAKRVILSGLLVSTASHLLSPLAARSSSYMMIAVQLLKGLSQGIVPSARSVLCSKWFPKSERGFLNSLIMTGHPFGVLISALLSGVLCSSPLLGGWPSVYYVYGILGLIFCLCFHIFVFESPTCHPRISDAELSFILEDQKSDLSRKRPPTPWRNILTSPSVYAATYAVFGLMWAGSHFYSIQPIFLGTILHFSIKESGFLISAPVVLQVILTFIVSWVCKWLNTKNYVGVNKARKGCNFLFCLGYFLCILGVIYAGCERVLSVSFSMVAMSLPGLAFNGGMITPLDMAPNFAGTLMGFSYTIGSLSNFIFPVLVGVMTEEKQTLEEWNKIFLISNGVIMSSGIIFCIFGSAEVQPWNYPTTDSTDKIQSNEKI